MKNYSLIIGVDVSKSKLDFIGINTDSKVLLSHKIIENKEAKIKTSFAKISNQFGEGNILIAFENTGVYGGVLASVMDALQLDYCELSALEVHRSSGIKRGKSDKSDALVIAQYVIANKFKIELSTPTTETIHKLKALYTQREKIIKSIKQFESNNEHKDFIPKSVFKEINKTNSNITKTLKKNLKLVNHQILEIINSDSALKQNYKLIQSIPGIGPQTTTYLLIITRNFTCFKNARKLA